jgi:hypothetical protein
VTGLSRRRFPFGDGDITLDLVDDSETVLFSCGIPRSAKPRASHGTIVTRGDALAGIYGVLRDGILELRDFLNGLVRPRGGTAALSPCDGRVESIEPARIVIRGVEERCMSSAARAGACTCTS